MWFKKKINPYKIKENNTKELISIGVKVSMGLPILDKANFRRSKDVAERMMVSLALFQLHLGAPIKTIEDWIEKNNLIGKLTNKETKYLHTNYEDLPEQDQIDLYWYIEAVWAFAWAGNLHENLTLNTGVEDSLASMLPNIQDGELALVFIQKYRLRQDITIFEMLDKFYRAHWYARSIKLKGKQSDFVDLDIIMERRKTLEFICYSEFEWNEISLDT
ncbi:DUF4272 domain-containing protein [Aureispira sp. CCB-QB1]|nr:DUF4272 domain-containing protein [Aureispira sp. CCB-QB1]